MEYGPPTESWLIRRFCAASFFKIREQSARHGGNEFTLQIFKGYLLIKIVDGLLHKIKIIRCMPFRMAEPRWEVQTKKYTPT
jgi:hypothetical protein